MAQIQISTPFNIDIEFELAQLYKRIVAYLIDFILLIIYLCSIKYILYVALDIEMETNVGLDIIIISIPMLVYSLIAEILMNGQTIGKKIFSIRVISLKGGKPTFGQFVLRWITKFFEWPFLFAYISIIQFIGGIFYTAILGLAVVIIIAVSKNNQRIGDLIANTVVVNTKSNLSINDTIFVDIKNNDYVVKYPSVMKLSDRDINTIKSVLQRSIKSNNFDLCNRVTYKIKDVLKIESDLPNEQFLQKLLADYNYLATIE